jgi:hypothetical protein
MPPVRDRLFSILACVSLLLCAATAALWVRSHWRLDIWLNDSRPNGPHWYTRNFEAISQNGEIQVSCSWNRPLTAVSHGWMYRDGPAAHSDVMTNYWQRHFPVWGHVGIVIKWERLTNADDQAFPSTANLPPGLDITIYLRYWLLTLVFAISPMIELQRLLSRRKQTLRQLRNHCANCGYDLRATPDRCPECGTVPPSRKSTGG